MFTECHPPCFSPPTQLSYRRQRHKEVNTLTTANSTAELTLPGEEDDYIFHIQTLSEGGLGPASDPIRIHQMSKCALGSPRLFSGCEKKVWGEEWFEFAPVQAEKRHNDCKKTKRNKTKSRFFFWNAPMPPRCRRTTLKHKSSAAGPPSLTSAFFNSWKWSHLALLKPDRDIVSSCWLTITGAPSPPPTSSPIPVLCCILFLKYAAPSISLAEVGLSLLLDVVPVLRDFVALLSGSKRSFALLIFGVESPPKTAAERDRIPRSLPF